VHNGVGGRAFRWPAGGGGTPITRVDMARAQEQNVDPPAASRETLMLIPYELMYRLGFAPWERRPVLATWQSVTEGPGALPPGRALDVGCGTGRDAVYLAQRGWQVTAVDVADAAIARARRRAADEGVQVQWVAGDVSSLTLVYDFGCIQGLADSARQEAAAGIAHLAAPGATLLVAAFAPGRRVLLPRGMDQQDVIGLFGDTWDLEHAESASDATAPRPVRRARPSLYRLTRTGQVGEPPGS
jgi:SAM-dependent methyltransferase